MTESPPIYRHNGTQTIPGIEFETLDEAEREHWEVIRRHCIALVRISEYKLGIEQSRPERVR